MNLLINLAQIFEQQKRDTRMKNVESDIMKIFGMNVFGETAMQQRLPKNVYEQLQHIIKGHQALDINIAEIVANAMKDWAIEKGATHYTHWFQPLTGITAEKHESFISPNGDGSIIMEFSGKELVQGEPDASSFPSGGLRATFEARGYTVWDVTSPAFIKDDENGKTLYIPTAFTSYTGEALDKKTPLLRSVESLSKQTIRVLRLLGDNSSEYAVPSVGPEQEYFLVDESFYNDRLDLQMTGRTLFGAPAPKGQELDDHYFGSIKERVSLFMNDLDMELWKLGISAKTKHNEVAPNQYELAVVYGECNVTIDQNHLVMETMKRVARRHKMVCLLHEKPFARVNGSGKHNNWSLKTDTGINLLSPGKTPEDNKRFLLFVAACVKAVDVHADLLRLSASTPGNDHRLGGHEAPPAIISVYLGQTLTAVFEKIEAGEKIDKKVKEIFNFGVSTLPDISMDDTDRNRTSPFAFTLNKFEFRMPPSQGSLARPNMILNTIIADTLAEFADMLEKDNDVEALLKDVYTKHKRVIFNGDGYSEKWHKEAEKRGLPQFDKSVDVYPELCSDKNVALFERQNVLSEKELNARMLIFLENYVMKNRIEASTMLVMAERQILPAVLEYQLMVAENTNKLQRIPVNCKLQIDLLKDLEKKLQAFSDGIKKLKADIEKLASLNEKDASIFTGDTLVVDMEKLREAGDALEEVCGLEYWPMPTYSDMLFKI